MRLTLTGTGPVEGFPAPDCPCAVCARARRDGVTAEPARLVSSDGWEISVDGVVTVDDALASQHSTGAPHELGPGEVLTLDRPAPGTRFEALGEGVVLIRTADLTVVWAPQVGEISDSTLDALVALAKDVPAPNALVLGPEPESSAAPGEMPSLGCARTIARLRARSVIGERTRCLLVGFGHRETHPARLQACLPAWGAELAVAGTAPGLPHPQSSPLPRLGRVLVLGGSGSGKSAFAEQLLSAAPEVVYLATGPKPVRSGEETASTGDDSSPTEHPEDDEWASRVRKHQERRPDWWSTLETIDVAEPLTGDGRAILLDSVGTWLSGVLDRCGAWDDRPGWKEQLDAETAALLTAWRERPGPLVAVSDEVGWSIVPSTESGRLFRDQLGRLNGKLAEASEDVHVIVAGRLLWADA